MQLLKECTRKAHTAFKTDAIFLFVFPLIISKKALIKKFLGGLDAFFLTWLIKIPLKHKTLPKS